VCSQVWPNTDLSLGNKEAARFGFCKAIKRPNIKLGKGHFVITKNM